MKDGHTKRLESSDNVLRKRPPVSFFTSDTATAFESIGAFGVEVNWVDGMPAEGAYTTCHDDRARLYRREEEE